MSKNKWHSLKIFDVKYFETQNVREQFCIFKCGI